LEFIRDNPKKLLEITKRLVYGLEGLAKRVEILNFENAQNRITSALSYLKKHFGTKLEFTHEDLASLTGLTRERVSIEMKRLKDLGKISYKRGVVTVKS
jgi:CRP-like cAMP-binding protein